MRVYAPVPKKPPTLGQILRQQHPERFAAAPAEARRARLADASQRALATLRSSARWQRLRALVMSEKPLCQTCERAGITRAATEVDHIVPALDVIQQRGEQAFFDAFNLESICDSCHDAKSARERAAR